MQNQQTLFMTSEKVEMQELKNLFFQLSSKACNMKCQYCYIKRDSFKNEPDFIDIEKIKNTLLSVKDLSLNSIYLTGGEPLLHPEFNQILRMCLKVANTTILSNGIMINDKKARFLRKLDDESDFETIYRISLDSVMELENDKYRGRGSFRKAINAIFSLLKYEFNPIVSVVNYNNRSRDEIFEEFRDYFSKKGFIFEDINLKIIPYFPMDNNFKDFDINKDTEYRTLDCSNSRIVSSSGIYACPVLVDDYRARMGSSIDDCSRFNYLESEKCAICTNLRHKAMANDWM